MHHHHGWEETIYYPMFNPKFDTSYIVAEHELFSTAVQVLHDYLVSCLPAGTKYGYGKVAGAHEQQTFDGAHLQSLIDAFANDLATHLMQEITYLEPEKIKSPGLTVEEMKNIASVSEKQMMCMSPITFLTYTILITPKTSQFPPAPGFVKNVLVPYVFSIPNRQYWQFAPKK